MGQQGMIFITPNPKTLESLFQEVERTTAGLFIQKEFVSPKELVTGYRPDLLPSLAGQLAPAAGVEGLGYLLKHKCSHPPNGGAKRGGAQNCFPLKSSLAGVSGRRPRGRSEGSPAAARAGPFGAQVRSREGPDNPDRERGPCLDRRWVLVLLTEGA